MRIRHNLVGICMGKTVSTYTIPQLQLAPLLVGTQLDRCPCRGVYTSSGHSIGVRENVSKNVCNAYRGLYHTLAPRTGRALTQNFQRVRQECTKPSAPSHYKSGEVLVSGRNGTNILRSCPSIMVG